MKRIIDWVLSKGLLPWLVRAVLYIVLMTVWCTLVLTALIILEGLLWRLSDLNWFLP